MPARPPSAGTPGPKGDTGETGAQGPQGEKGDKGDTGAAGAQGPKGDTGAAGADGADGATGAKGEKGDKGDTGAQGPQGETGAKGDPGETGAKGEKGDKGDKGDTGDPGTGVFYESHTWTLHDEVKVPAGDTDFLAPMRLKLRGNQTCKIVAVEYRANNGAAGTRFTFKLQKNGEDITGFTGLQTPESTAWKETDPEDKALADGDSIAPVITAITGTPKNGSITIVLEHTVT